MVRSEVVLTFFIIANLHLLLKPGFPDDYDAQHAPYSHPG